MKRMFTLSIAWIAAMILSTNLAMAASPSVEQALKLAPVQKTVDFTRPSAAEADDCKISAEKINGQVGWIVRDPNGLTLRMFLDTNGDNVVDRWCYYKNGLEVYRDIDADFNGKADQYRWFHTGGSRWALDKNEDSRIDGWKTISAEEVTAEVIAAMAARDADRFARLLLSSKELKKLALGPDKASSVAKKTNAAAAQFAGMAARQKTVSNNTRWIQFSATQPGTIPAGTDGSTKDLRVYENAVAVVETGGKHDQVHVGTLVKVGDSWRVIDLPRTVADNHADTTEPGLFFQTSVSPQSTASPTPGDDKSQRLLTKLEKLDQAAERATTPAEQAELNAQRADLLEKIAATCTNAADRDMWLRQLADMVSAAVQSGAYPGGAERLEKLFTKLQKNKADDDLAAYVRFRQLTADYGLALQAPKADFAKIQTDWLDSLEKYVTDYPTSPDAAEAMLQLAIAEEFAGQEDAAKQWYGKIVKTFANTAAAKKAKGALTRLGSVGKIVPLAGKDPHGSPIDLRDYRGKTVVIQYWATWCEPAIRDMKVLKNLAKEHGRKFAVVGVCLDHSRETLNEFLAENRLPWRHIYESGGLDSRPANQLGILTLPTMILVDSSGKVVNRNIQAAELDEAVEKLVK